MGTYHTSESLIINAPAAHVYAILADYHVGHPAIVPKQYFKKVEVLEGGQGAGTKILVQMSVFGVEAEFNMVVTEPDPGRVLVETDAAAGVTTTFTVESIGDGSQSQTTISSATEAPPGIRGWIEQRINPIISRRIYREELALLADYATNSTSSM